MSVKAREIRRNLAPNPRSVSNTGWTHTNTGGTVAASALTGQSFPGGITTAYRLTWSATSTGVATTIQHGAGAAPYTIPVTAGQTVTGSIYGRTSRAGQGAACRLTWLNASATPVGTAVTGTEATTVANTAARYEATGVVPATATRVRVELVFTTGSNWVSGNTADATGAMVEVVSSAGAYFDGATTATGPAGTLGSKLYAWTNATNASASVEQLVVPGTQLTVTAEPAAAIPRVRIDIVTDTSTPLTITRTAEDGRAAPVRTATGDPVALIASGSDWTATLYDYEAPFGQVVSYTAVEAAETVPASTTLAGSDVWLIHPAIPELSMVVDLGKSSFSDEAWGVDQGVFWPMGRKRPVIITDGARHAPSSSIDVLTDTLGELEAIRSLVDDAGVLFMNIPPELGYGVDSDYISVAGVNAKRLVDIGGRAERVVTLPYQVVERPVGGSQAERNWADVIAENATWADVLAKYDSWADVLAGP